jgi:hypothetical protein
MQRAAKCLLLTLAALCLPIAAAHASWELPLLAYKPGMDPQAFVPVSYQCPLSKSDGTVEIVKMNTAGGRVKFRVTFAGDVPTHASVQRALRNMPFEGWYEFASPGTKPDAEADRNVLETVVGDAQALRAGICFGIPATKEKYDKILEYNRRHLDPWPSN